MDHGGALGRLGAAEGVLELADAVGDVADGLMASACLAFTGGNSSRPLDSALSKLCAVGAEKPFFFPAHRIDDQAEAMRLAQKCSLRASVGAAKKGAQVGMAMIPAYDG